MNLQHKVVNWPRPGPALSLSTCLVLSPAAPYSTGKTTAPRPSLGPWSLWSEGQSALYGIGIPVPAPGLREREETMSRPQESGLMREGCWEAACGFHTGKAFWSSTV